MALLALATLVTAPIVLLSPFAASFPPIILRRFGLGASLPSAIAVPASAVVSVLALMRGFVFPVAVPRHRAGDGENTAAVAIVQLLTLGVAAVLVVTKRGP